MLWLFLAGKMMRGLERHLAQPAPISSNNAPAFDFLACRSRGGWPSLVGAGNFSLK